MKVNPNDAPKGYKAVEPLGYSCGGCALNDSRKVTCTENDREGFSCFPHSRKDCRNVIFVKKAPKRPRKPKAPKCSVLFSNGKHCGLKATKATTVSPSLNSHWRALSQGITSLEILVCPRCHKLLKL